MDRRRIGIMGGTFDPIHCGHLLAAEQAREQAELDEVWFLPAGVPPHKRHEQITAAHHRLRMVELAIANHPAFRVNRCELERSGPSYTFDTIRALTEEHPNEQFFFIIGGDMVNSLHQWHRFPELIQLVRFIGLHRPGSVWDPQQLAAFVTYVEMPLWDVSSSLIREKVKAGRSIRYFVPQAVERYIKENGLYGASL